MTVCNQDILARLPHQPPFRFITRLTAMTPGRAGEAVWEVTGEEACFQGHFPGDPLVPGVLIGEALAQLAGLIALADAADANRPLQGRLAQMDLRFYQAVAPPVTIALAAVHTRTMGQLCQCDVEAHAGGKLLARGTLVVALATSPGETP